MKAMSELFALPLETVPRARRTAPDWDMAIIKQGNTAWVAEVYPRTEGRWGQTLLVSAQERAEAIAQAINGYDAIREKLAAAEARAERLARLTRLEYDEETIKLFSSPGWGTTELGRAQAALQPGDLKEMTK
jgi:hypothetical protein